HIKVEAPCGGEPWLVATETFALPASVGSVSIATFDAHGLRFAGNERGINQILDTPIGDDALEIISDGEMRAYGWCYALDGQIEERLADEVPVTSDESKIVWFFAYAHYQYGSWQTYCIPTAQSRPAFVCAEQ